MLFLNSMVVSDKDATQQIVENRVKCNQELTDHPYVIVTENNEVGILGILNGILTFSKSKEVVAISYREDGSFDQFITLPVSERSEP